MGMASARLQKEKDQHYLRVHVTCPFHRNCKKSRNQHERQCSLVGELEPYAYLGLWLKAGQQMADRDMHIKKFPEPTKEELEGYLRQIGYM